MLLGKAKDKNGLKTSAGEVANAANLTGEWNVNALAFQEAAQLWV
jgi:hypothetical protein